MTFSHHLMARYCKDFAQNNNHKSEKFYRIFNEVPTIYTLSGAGLIVISSAIIFVREHQLKKPITLPRQQ